MLKVRQIRFVCQALDRTYFGHAGNTMHGALSGPLGSWAPLAIPRVRHLQHLEIQPQSIYSFDIVLLLDLPEALDLVQSIVPEVLAAGIGAGRGRSAVRSQTVRAHDIDLLSQPEECSNVRVRFVTPTEWKVEGKPVAPGDFAILFRRLRQRIRAVLERQGSPDVNAAHLLASSQAVRIVRSDLGMERHFRRSTRTARSHPVGGFRGAIEYSGVLGPFWPWLKAGEWAGIGRHTGFGNGEMLVEAMDRPRGGRPTVDFVLEQKPADC